MKKIKLSQVDLALGIIIIVYGIFVIITAPNRIAFNLGFMFIGAVFIIYHFVKNKLNKTIRKVINGLIIIGITCFAAILIVISVYPKQSTEKCDYILVLGAGLKDGDEVSRVLQDRLEAAIECYDNYDKGAKIVVSGGKGSNEDVSEAEAMKRYLVKKGVSEDIIIKEDKSTSTKENFEFSKDKIEEDSGMKVSRSKVKVVTTDFHAFRSNLLAKNNNYGKVEIYTSDSYPYLIPIFYTREVLALIKDTIFSII